MVRNLLLIVVALTLGMSLGAVTKHRLGVDLHASASEAR
jgi:hypothetical protein